VTRASAKPVLAPVTPAPTQKAAAGDTLKISRDKFQISGPLGSRKVLKAFVPQYPAWARAKNIEADVAIRISVAPDGSVRDGAVVDRTSGYTELDKLAIEALKNWKFAPFAGGQDQWGVITFRFLLD